MTGGIDTDQRRRDRLVNVLDRSLNPLAAVAVAAVPKLDGFESPRRRPGRHRCPSKATAGEVNLGFDCRVPAAVEDLTSSNVGDGRGHSSSPL